MVVTVVVGSIFRVTVMQPERQIRTARAITSRNRGAESLCCILSKLPLKFVPESIGGRYASMAALRTLIPLLSRTV